MQIGDRVVVDTPGSFGNRRAEVTYIGKTEIAPGYWMGVRYDDTVGKNDGSVRGVRYFDCPPDHGGLLRPNLIKLDLRPPSNVESKTSTADAVKALDEGVKKRGRKQKKNNDAADVVVAPIPPPQQGPTPVLSSPHQVSEPMPAVDIAEGGEMAAERGGVLVGSFAHAPAQEAGDIEEATQRIGSMAFYKDRIGGDIDVEEMMAPSIDSREVLHLAQECPRVPAVEELTHARGTVVTEAPMRRDLVTLARKKRALAQLVAADAVKHTAAEASTASGPGLHTSIVRQLGVFTIIAHDHKGNRLLGGGESLAVAIRGTSNVRARLTDNNDGSYTCKYRAWVSGAYTVAIWLNGEQLGQSPYSLQVLSTRSEASRCELRGGGLTSAVSREPASFEVEFVDAFGQVCYAEELDVYVELEDSSSQALVGQSQSDRLGAEGRSACPAPSRPAGTVTGEADPAVTAGSSGAVPPISSPSSLGELVVVESRPSLAVAIDLKAALAIGPAIPKTTEQTAPSAPEICHLDSALASGSGTLAFVDAGTTALSGACDDGHPHLTVDSADGGSEALVPGRSSTKGQPGLARAKMPKKLEAVRMATQYSRIDAIERQQHMQLWARRRATDQAAHMLLHSRKVCAPRIEASLCFYVLP